MSEGLPAFVPKSVPEARKALAAMERDVDAAQTYDRLRKLMREAEAIRILYREYRAVGRDAERVMLLAAARTGEELAKAPAAKGTRGQLTGPGVIGVPLSGTPIETGITPTLAEQVGSANRGVRFKKLAEVGREQLLDAASALWEKGKEATQTAVLKLIAGDEIKRKRADYDARADRGGKAGDLAAMAEAGQRFSVIYADPPWEFKVYSGKGKSRSAERHYDTSSLEAIKALPIDPLAASDCALFLWCVMPELPGALDVIAAWGFNYKTVAFVWVKQNRGGEGLFTGMGYWTRANAELCLLATRGSPQRIEKDVHQVVLAPVAEHSRKPEDVRKRIERLLLGPYLELFARVPAEGWTVWGNEISRAPLDLTEAAE